MPAEFLTAASLPARHGFFTRRGGVSTGPFAALNCSLSSPDERALVLQNRALVAQAMGAQPSNLVGVTQVHGAEVATVTAPWAPGAGPRADAMVSAVPGLALGVITADCTPVLFAAPSVSGGAKGGAGVVGAAHAGWRGALAGVLEATVAAMHALGAQPGQVRAVIGPCIAQPSYEVGSDLRDAVLAHHEGDGRFFGPGARPGHWQFDLPGYCAARLAGLAAVEVLGVDTMRDEARFWSHRRRTLAGGGPIGHQISVVVA